ncbi:hypothetical protein [Winogradskyella sp.]|uniref:hypothetical protein n=1 Tax=Winogradskyella sp. TaxID=1883156 RepID=UPI003BAD30CF
MTRLNLKKHFPKIVILIVGIYWVYNYFENQHEIKNMDFGMKANQIRTAINIPIIDEYMNSKNGYRWETRNEKPKAGETLHVWKNIRPSESEKLILNNEFDAFRRRDENGRVMQFNIISNVIGDSTSLRSGKFFYFDSKLTYKKDLTEKEIDSISISWGLDYLVKNKFLTI